jgi:uncharacterized coiled-coil DUF342 family protein
MKFEPKAMRDRFAELGKQRDAILAKSTPLREKRDAHVNQARETEAKMNTAIKKVEVDLFDIDQERGMLVRALGGKTGEPETEAAPAE